MINGYYQEPGNTQRTALDAEEMILANGAAEAREADALREQVKAYSAQIEELKELYEKNSALVEKLTKMDLPGLESSVLSAIEESRGQIADMLQKSDEFSHRENVRVYRNIQASTDQLLRKQSEELLGAAQDAKGQEARPRDKVRTAPLIVALLILAVQLLDSFGIMDMLVRMIRG